MRAVAVLLAVALTGAGTYSCGAASRESVPRGGGPPGPMTLVIAGRSATDSGGSFCASTEDGVGACGDTALRAGPLLRVPAGRVDVVLRWPYRDPALNVSVTPGPACLTASCSPGPSTKLGTTRAGGPLRAALRPGAVQLDVEARWSRGDAFYQWSLDVR